MFGRDVVLRFGGFFGVRKVDLRNTGMFAGRRRQAGIDCVIIYCIDCVIIFMHISRESSSIFFPCQIWPLLGMSC